LAAKTSDEPAASTWTLAGAVEIGKNALALLRDFVLFVLVMLLLAYPAKLNDILTRAGFDEGSIVGFKWKAKLVDSDAALKEARATINDLTTQLNKTSAALSEAQAKLGDPATNASYARLAQENSALTTATAKVQSAVSRTIADNATLVQAAQDVVSGGEWAVVFSGDASLEGAKHEVEVVAPKLGVRRPAIYRRQGVYRSVLLADDRADAQEQLSRAKQRRADAYVVRMSAWCPTSEAREGFRECAADSGR
jgi:hypothetical protein